MEFCATIKSDNLLTLAVFYRNEHFAYFEKYGYNLGKRLCKLLNYDKRKLFGYTRHRMIIWKAMI